MALMAIIGGLGLLCYILLGFRLRVKRLRGDDFRFGVHLLRTNAYSGRDWDPNFPKHQFVEVI